MAGTGVENTIIFKNVRLAFPALWEAKQVNGEGDPAFSATALFSADDPQVDAIEKLIDKVAQEKWGAKAGVMLKAIRGADKTALHNGDSKAQYDGFAGNYFVSARTTTRPLIVDVDKTELTPVDGRPYGGCYVNMNVQIWAQDNKWGKRINATLRWVQFYRDGDAFSAAPPATPDEIPDISMDDDSTPPEM